MLGLSAPRGGEPARALCHLGRLPPGSLDGLGEVMREAERRVEPEAS